MDWTNLLGLYILIISILCGSLLAVLPATPMGAMQQKAIPLIIFTILLVLGLFIGVLPGQLTI